MFEGYLARSNQTWWSKLTFCLKWENKPTGYSRDASEQANRSSNEKRRSKFTSTSNHWFMKTDGSWNHCSSSQTKRLQFQQQEDTKIEVWTLLRAGRSNIQQQLELKLEVPPQSQLLKTNFEVTNQPDLCCNSKSHPISYRSNNSKVRQH
jgi:hypothetical protein